MKDVLFDNFGEENSRYKIAMEFFRKMHTLGKVWSMFVPTPPLNRSDLMVMGRICVMNEKGEKLTVSKLAELMGQTGAAISQKIRFLEENGLVKRTGDKKDRRITLVEPTEKGRKMTAAQMEEFFGKLEHILLEVGEENTQQLMRLFDKFADALEKKLGDEEQLPLQA